MHLNNCINKFRVFLFDFDGTLVNTTPLILRSFKATWQQMFGFTLAESEYRQTFGIPLETAMVQLLTRLIEERLITAPTHHDETVTEMVAVYRAFNHEWHDQMIQPFAGVDELLLALQARGCRMGLVTSKKRVGVQRGMKIFEMEAFFDVTVCAEDTRHHKPHPEPLRHAMKGLSAEPDETIYIGDSPHDIVAGKAAGITTAAAVWGPFARHELENFAPDYLADSPLELLRLESEVIAARKKNISRE